MRKKAENPHEVGLVVGEFMENGDLEGIVSMFHPDCVICYPKDAAPQYGHDAVREVFSGLLSLKAKTHNTVLGVQQRGDIALLHQDWSFEDGDGNLLAEGKSMEVVHRLENGGWGYLIDCPEGPPAIA